MVEHSNFRLTDDSTRNFFAWGYIKNYLYAPKMDQYDVEKTDHSNYRIVGNSYGNLCMAKERVLLSGTEDKV